VQRRELALVEIEGLDISRRFYMASRTGRELSPAAKAFTEVMVETYGDTGGGLPSG
jgi:LysR family transcriptional regulator, low CO2-responsive transcriptional regulator